MFLKPVFPIEFAVASEFDGGAAVWVALGSVGSEVPGAGEQAKWLRLGARHGQRHGQLNPSYSAVVG
jgi:hypothetical protein